MSKLNAEEHKKRHEELHAAFDELLSDFLLHQPITKWKGLKGTSIMELIQWSQEQCKNPEEFPKTPHEE